MQRNWEKGGRRRQMKGRERERGRDSIPSTLKSRHRHSACSLEESQDSRSPRLDRFSSSFEVSRDEIAFHEGTIAFPRNWPSSISRIERRRAPRRVASHPLGPRRTLHDDTCGGPCGYTAGTSRPTHRDRNILSL